MFRLTVLLASRWFLLLGNISKERGFPFFCNAPSGAGLSGWEMLVWRRCVLHRCTSLPFPGLELDWVTTQCDGYWVSTLLVPVLKPRYLLPL